MATPVAVRSGPSDAARKRAAVELIREQGATLRRTARRYSICEPDAEDAYQRALEILLKKAPTDDPRDLIRWMQVVTKHEALAVRRNRERMLPSPALQTPGGDDGDWVQQLPSERDGPLDRAERQERISRAREALQALKPQELRALTLLAEGYSYSEIRQKTGWTYTKVNRCLAEGRQRFREVLARIEEGSRCEELGPALSAFCDGEAGDRQERELREHLRVCSACRAKLRTFRAAPRAAAALAPALPLARPLSDRLHDLLATTQAKLPGRAGAIDAASQAAAGGGSKGVGTALIAKVLAACVGTAGGAAACVAAGVVPPVDVGPEKVKPAGIERQVAHPTRRTFEEVASEAADYVPPPAPSVAPAGAAPTTSSSGSTEAASETAGSSAPATPPAEFSPESPPPAAPPPSQAATGTSGGGSAGSGTASGSGTTGGRGSEFGP